MPSASPTWVTAFIDLPADSYDAGVAFWCGVTGYSLSPSRGERGEFATLVPPEGDAYLRVQRVDDGPGGVHLDLHRPGQPFEVRRSPGGFTYCEVSEPLAQRPPVATWPGGHRSQVDQVSLDIAPAAYEAECAFWSEQLGLPQRQSPYFEEFRTLVRPLEQPVRLLLQRVGDDRPEVTAHLDVYTSDRAAEVRRHEELGATVLREHSHFTVLTDPTGAAYCITPRNDETGMKD